jgi:hypothetical protein
VSSLATERSGFAPSAPWLAGAIAAGLGAGLLVLEAPLALALVVAALVVTAATAIILERPDMGMLVLVATLSLDTAGVLMSDPIPVTAYQVLLLLSLMTWVVRRAVARSWRWTGSRGLVAVAFLILFAAAWSLPFSADVSGTVLAGVRLAFLSLFALLVADLASEEVVQHRIQVVVVISAVVMSLVATAQWLGYIPLVERTTRAVGTTPRPSAFFGDPNYFAGLLSVAVVVAVARAVSAVRVREALAWMAGVPLLLGVLILTLSRTGWVGVFAGLVTVAVLAPARRRRDFVAAVVFVVLLGVAIAPGAAVDRFASIFEPEAQASTQTRLLMVESSVDMVRDNWVNGVGLSAFDEVYPRYYRAGAAWGIVQPHQVPLALIAEAGVAGLLAEIGIVALAVAALRRSRGRRSPLFVASFAGLATLATEMLFQNFLYFEYAWLFLALTVVTAARAPEMEA